VINLRRPEGVAVPRRLVTAADVLIEGYRPGRPTGSGSDQTVSEPQPKVGIRNHD